MLNHREAARGTANQTASGRVKHLERRWSWSLERSEEVTSLSGYRCAADSDLRMLEEEECAGLNATMGELTAPDGRDEHKRRHAKKTITFVSAELGGCSVYLQLLPCALGLKSTQGVMRIGWLWWMHVKRASVSRASARVPTVWNSSSKHGSMTYMVRHLARSLMACNSLELEPAAVRDMVNTSTRGANKPQEPALLQTCANKASTQIHTCTVVDATAHSHAWSRHIHSQPLTKLCLFLQVWNTSRPI